MRSDVVTGESGAGLPIEKNMKRAFWKLCLAISLAFIFVAPVTVWSQEDSAPSAGPKLVRSVMCEYMQKLTPANQAVIFSIDLGRVVCFTEFDQVTRQTVIHHKWYRKDNLISVKQLSLNPPRWSSFSSMQLRDADKGPWRVDVTDENDNVIYTLRFSITD